MITVNEIKTGIYSVNGAKIIASNAMLAVSNYINIHCSGAKTYIPKD